VIEIEVPRILLSPEMFHLFIFIAMITLASSHICDTSSCRFEEGSTTEHCIEYSRWRVRLTANGTFIYGAVEEGGECVCQTFDIRDVGKVLARIATLEARVESLEHPELYRFATYNNRKY
jgi:hypothetical protein